MKIESRNFTDSAPCYLGQLATLALSKSAGPLRVKTNQATFIPASLHFLLAVVLLTG